MGKINFLHTKKSQKISLITVAVVAAVIMIGVLVWVVVQRNRGTDSQSAVPADTLVEQTNDRLDKELDKKLSPDDRANLLQAKISNYESVGKYDDALLVARVLAKEFPQVAAYRADIARLYGLKGDVAQQRKGYKEAIDIVASQPVTNETNIERAYYETQLGSVEVKS